MVVLRVGLGLQFGFAEGREKQHSTLQFDHGTFDLRSRTARSTAHTTSGREPGHSTLHVVNIDKEKKTAFQGDHIVHTISNEERRSTEVV